MADTTRYVNTASTAGGDGTTNATSGANRAYASLSEWESAEQGTVGAGDRHIVECSGTAADTTAVAIAGWTINDADSLIIRGNRGDSAGFYDGNFEYSTSHYRIEPSTTDHALHIDTQNVLVDGIQLLQFDANFEYALFFERPSGADVFTVQNCRLRGQTGGPNGIMSIIIAGDNSVVVVRNNIVDGGGSSDSQGIDIETRAFTENLELTVANNSVFRAGRNGIRWEAADNTDGGTVNFHNNAVAGSADADYEQINGTAFTVNLTHNASDDVFGTSAQDMSPGTPESTEWEDHWTDPNASAGSIDLTVVSGGALDGNGTTGGKIPTTDILGNTRDGTSPSIGAFEVAAGGGVAGAYSPVIERYYRTLMAGGMR